MVMTSMDEILYRSSLRRRQRRALLRIYSRLLKDRIVFLGGQVNDAVANLIIAQMLFLSNEDSKSDIHFYINSPAASLRRAWRSTTRCSSAL